MVVQLCQSNRRSSRGWVGFIQSSRGSRGTVSDINVPFRCHICGYPSVYLARKQGNQSKKLTVGSSGLSGFGG